MRKLWQRFKSPSDSSFIASYLRKSEATETPPIFNLWGALWVIGNIAGRAAYVARPLAPVYLNWYVIIVADSGVARKSTAIRHATEILRRYAPEYAEFIEGKVTPEKLEQTLALQSLRTETAHAIISVSELVSILGRERYTMGMPGLLTDLYDAPQHRRSPGSLRVGQLDMHNVFVSLLSASTGTWLSTAINPSIVEGGFTSRCIFVVGDGTGVRRIAWPTQPRQEDIDAAESACARLAIRAQSAGPMRLSEGGLTRYTQWYNRRELHTDAYRSSFESREDAHVLRAAACFALNDSLPEIQVDHINLAIEVVEDAKERGYGLFSASIADGDTLAEGIDYLRMVLVSVGGDAISTTDLGARLARRLTGHQLRTALRVMHELGLVQKFSLPRQGAGRPTTVWRATKAIMAQDALNIVKGKVSDVQ